ncbi:tripartite tricarboxylate transporter substrate binding protein [Siccirubricoccus sp. KC 17139]|uniref:Tripartite tricarboxylate transporter substrate binding protein n=1 Tax=Siccirubricoccus soli TaxID=2899147 RepID=A0ABT1D5D9_9PROT|nr:tripartite tricarboxylate transporter substrate binding protein [Siccirubricoccus soli]MCO6416515.1 tripartite tricarboxylate transporter substrate binding protein [Siccirubricoccus soli]MCP2682649.1 tripartite tricarboxylate transporter substrate binding protein [Siccirubricoccus soli]
MTHSIVKRRDLMALAATPVLAVPRLATAQQNWPARPITMVVPYPPGGTTDLAARPVAPKLSEILGQAVVIENRGGAGGSIGAAAVAQAKPDGYTLLAFPTAVLTISPHIMSLPYDPATAFTPISMSAVAYGVIAAHPSLPFRDIAGLVAHAKAHPGQLRFGSAGNGTITQLSGEMFAEATGIRLEHVPYRGSAPSLTDLLAGRVQLLFDPVALPAIQEGRVVAIATIAETRNPQLPAVPTLREAGLQQAEALPWFGIAAPTGLPRPILNRLTRALETALAAPEVAQAMALMGLTPRFEAGEAFANRIHREREMYGAVVRRIEAKAG